jgi:hypothetical protein
MFIDPRDFYDGPPPDDDPFAVDPAACAEALGRSLGLPPARAEFPNLPRDFGDPEAKW